MICKHEGCTNLARTYTRTYKTGKTYHCVDTECLSCKNKLSKYGITTPQRDALLLSQNNQCGCCGFPISFTSAIRLGAGKSNAVIDHDHTTGKVRGILCGECNTGIGKLGDSIESLKKALNYLERNQ